MKIIKENYIFIILIILSFTVDRYSKIEILKLLGDKNYLFINDFLNLNLVFNTGIGFGLFTLNDGIFYNLLSTLIFIIILVLLFLMFKSKTHEKFFFFINNWRCDWKPI